MRKPECWNTRTVAFVEPKTMLYALIERLDVDEPRLTNPNTPFAPKGFDPHRFVCTDDSEEGE